MKLCAMKWLNCTGFYWSSDSSLGKHLYDRIPQPTVQEMKIAWLYDISYQIKGDTDTSIQY